MKKWLHDHYLEILMQVEIQPNYESNSNKQKRIQSVLQILY